MSPGRFFELVKVVRFHGLRAATRNSSPCRNLSCHCTVSLQTQPIVWSIEDPVKLPVMMLPSAQSKASESTTMTIIGMFSCSTNWLASTLANRNYQENGCRRAAFLEAVLVLAICFSVSNTSCVDTTVGTSVGIGRYQATKTYAQIWPPWLNNGCQIGRFVLQGAHDTHK